MLPTPSLTTWRVSITIPYILAIASTVFRLSDRYRKRRLSWDDYWASLSLVFVLIMFVSSWFPSGSTQQLIILFWVGSISFPCAVWSARISMAFSITRLLPPRSTIQRCVFAIVGFFGLACIVLLSQKIWVCSRSSTWHHSPAVVCYLGHPVGVISLCTDVVADSLLIAIPFRMLWNVKLHPSQRRLILSLFAASILSSLASIVYAAFVFEAQTFGPARKLLLSLAVDLTVSISLLVCNLLVVVTCLYRVFRNGEDLEAPESSDEVSNIHTRTVPLTTISFTDISDNNFIDTNHTNSQSLASSSKHERSLGVTQ